MGIEMMFGIFLSVMITVSALCAYWYAADAPNFDTAGKTGPKRANKAKTFLGQSKRQPSF